MSQRRTALLIGATGLIGSRALEHLSKRGEIYERVTCLVRRKNAIETNERIHEHVVDFDALKDDDVGERVDDIYCAIGSTMKKAGSKEAFRRVDYDLPLAVAKLAFARGAKRMALVSSIGADAHAGSFYLKVKGELEDALATLVSSTKGETPSLHIFQPSFLVGDRQESRPGEAVAVAMMKVTKGILFGGLRKYRPIDVDDVARAMVFVMTTSSPDCPSLKARNVYLHDEIMGLSKSL